MFRRFFITCCLYLLLLSAEGQNSFQWKKLKYEFSTTFAVSQIRAGLRFSGAAGHWLNDRQALYVGAGIDLYTARSIPLYVEYRQKINQRPDYFFLYAGGGVNFTTPSSFNRQNATSINDVEPVQFHTGWSAHYGIGKFFIRRRRKDTFVLLGNSMKTYGTSVLQRVPIGSVMTNEVKSSRFFSGRLDLTIITPLFNY